MGPDIGTIEADFTIGSGAGSSYSCSLVIQNRMLVFGGNIDMDGNELFTQISEVKGLQTSFSPSEIKWRTSLSIKRISSPFEPLQDCTVYALIFEQKLRRLNPCSAIVSAKQSWNFADVIRRGWMQFNFEFILLLMFWF